MMQPHHVFLAVEAEISVVDQSKFRSSLTIALFTTLASIPFLCTAEIQCCVKIRAVLLRLVSIYKRHRSMWRKEKTLNPRFWTYQFFFSHIMINLCFVTHKLKFGELMSGFAVCVYAWTLCKCGLSLNKDRSLTLQTWYLYLNKT